MPESLQQRLSVKQRKLSAEMPSEVAHESSQRAEEICESLTILNQNPEI